MVEREWRASGERKRDAARVAHSSEQSDNSEAASTPSERESARATKGESDRAGERASHEAKGEGREKRR